MKNTLVLVCIAIILGMNIAKSQTIGGDYQNLEPGLQGRTDILFYEGFSTAQWVNNWQYVNSRTTMSTTGFDNNALNVFLPQGQIGDNSGSTALSTFLKNLPGVESLHEEMYMRYYIYLDPNFDFQQGGKVPGMAANALYGAGRHPTGGDGWTARYMWNAYGELYLYAYLPFQTGTGGSDLLDYSGKRARLEKGKWHCVEQYIKLNTVSGTTGNPDGKCYTWLDGNLCLKLENIVYRNVINDAGKQFGIYASMFYGGSDYDWAPSNDTYIKIDNVVMAKNYIGPRTGANVLTTPSIATAGGTFLNPVDVSINTGGNEIRYTTNGEEPTYCSNKYTNPFKVAKSATVKARAYNSSNVRYSGTTSQTYTINSTAGTTAPIISATADSYFRNGTMSNYENTNYGTSGTLELKSGSFNYDRKAAIKFPLSGLTTFHTAKLRIYANSASVGSKVGFFEMPPNWTETGITSLNAPGSGDLLQTAEISAAGWIEIDATNYVASQISQGATEVSFYVMLMNETAASLKSRTATSNKPELVIVNTGSGVTSDTQAPSVPTGLASASVAQTSFTLNWEASTDNVGGTGVAGYEVFRDGNLIGTPTGTSFIVPNLTAGTTYSLKVRAKDVAGNWSAQSSALSVTSVITKLPVIPEELQTSLTVSPNPASEFIHLSYVANNSIISIFSSDGKIVYQNIKKNNGEHTMSVHDLSKGLFFIRIQNEKETIVKKLIIE